MKAVKRNRIQSLGNTYYNAAQYSEHRSNSWLAFPLFAEKEYSQLNRENILKKKRWLQANLGIVQALIRKVGRYAVGEGLHPCPETSDLEWNELVKNRFIEWASSPSVCDALARQTFWDMQKNAAENLFSEGEAFFAMVNSSIKASPQIQAWGNGEVRYVGSGATAPGMLAPGEYTYFDGCKINRNGVTVAYSVQTMDGGGFVDIDAANMVHITDGLQPNQVRAISPFAPCANSAVDALDLKAMETQSTKLHSALGIVVTKSTGRGIGEAGFTSNLKQFLDTTAGVNGTAIPTGTTAIGEEFFSGAQITHLGQGDDIKLLSSSRPSINIVQYLEWLYRDICQATGLNIELVWNLDELGGVNARITLADAQFFFDHIQKKIASMFCRRVYTWWVSTMIQNGSIPECKDFENWWHCSWQGPRKIDVDRNQIASQIQALDAGFTTQQDFYKMFYGADWKAKIKQRISEVAFAKAQCVAQGVTYQEVFPSKPGAAPAAQGAPEDFSGSSNPPAQTAQATAPARPAMLLPPHQQEEFARALNSFNDILRKMQGEANALSLSS